MEGKVKCSGCGWSWNKSDSSKKDMYVCHQCGKDNVMKNGGWLNKYDDGGDVQPNYNDSSASMSEDFVGLGYDTQGRNYSPAWGGQFQGGGDLLPVSPTQQVQQAVQPTPTVPYLQTKDPAEFYKSWIQSPEYAKRQLLTGYSEGEDLYMPNAAASRESRLGAIEEMTPITYNTRQPSEAKPGVYGSPSYVNINPSDYVGTSKEAIQAHELAHVAGAMGEVRPGMMSAKEQEMFKKSMLPMKEPVLSGVQGSKEREASVRALEDFKHSQEPDEAKADLDALRFMMYDKGIYDITKGKKFTETDFQKAKQNLGNDRVFKRLENRMGKENFVKLMNTIASSDNQEELPIAMGGMSIPGSVGFSYARVAGAAPSKGKYAKKAMASAQKGKQVQKGVDSTLENIFEVVDPTGVSSWDDVYQSYQKSGMSPETKLEILGALPILGKVGKAGKLLGPALSAGQTNKRLKTNAKLVSNVMQSIPYIGRGTDATQAVQQFSDVPFFPTAPPAGVGQFGRYAGMPSMDLEKKQYGGEIPSAQNGIMSPMLLARNVLNYFYPSEEAAPAVEAAPSDYKKGLTNELLQRQAYKESTFNPAAVSPAGYKGIAQIGEGVLKDYSNKKGGKKLDPFNPEDAVELQKFAMDDLYNASFINKPNQPDSVRIAKTLAAYNWGRGNLSNYLNEQKSKGVDIYDSYDWLNNLPKETSDYVNKILLQEDPSFNKNYKKASTNPKYEEVTSLYDQKKFGGDIPSAQNGQEMRFYQNGLDWKPKSMQNGGDEIYEGLELPEFVVEGKDERMKEAMSQGIRKFYAHVGELMGAPQKEMMQLITGKEQTPSEAFGFQNTGGWLDSPTSFGKNLSNFGMDAVLDPVNAIPGIGLVDDLTKGAVRAAAQNVVSKPLQRGLSPFGYEFENIARIPQNLIRNLEGKSKKFSSAVQRNINEGRAQFILQGLKNREDAWSTYLGLDRDFNTMKLVGSDDVTGLSKYEYTNPIVFEKASPRPNPKAGAQSQRMAKGLYDFSEGRLYNRKILENDYKHFSDLDLNVPGSSTVGNDKLFGTMGGYQKYVSPDGKNLMYRDVWDLQPFSRLTSKQLPKDMLGNAIRNFEVSSIVPGAKPFVAEGKLGDIKTKFLPAQSYKNTTYRYNQIKDYLAEVSEPDEDYFNQLTKEQQSKFIKDYQDGLKSKIKALMSKSKQKSFLNPSPSQDFIKYVDTNPYTRFGDSKPDLTGFDFTPSRPEKFLQKIQDVANQPVSKFEVGGVIKDDRGQWAYPGEVTEIDSNYITMDGVPYDVLGVSNTGDTKLMKPGKNYKFKGKKVREYPVAKLGINQLDAQPMKKLNQLLNFTNNPDKDNWLDKYN